MLYLVEAASWNQIEGVGLAYYTDTGDYIEVGGTDNMPYHTGTMATDLFTSAASQWRWIESLCRNDSELVNGYEVDDSGRDAKVYFAAEDGNRTDYVSAPKILSFRAERVRDFISNSVPGYEWALVPTCTPPASSAAPSSEYLGDERGNYIYRQYSQYMNALKYPHIFGILGWTWMPQVDSASYRVMRFTAE